MRSYLMNYGENSLSQEAYIAYDSKHTLKRPGILIAPTLNRKDEFTHDKAEYMASLGYVGFAFDMDDQAQPTHTTDDLIHHREALLAPLRAAYNALKTVEIVDPKRIAILGYGFGGLCALDLARSGADLAGALAFHSPLCSPALEKQNILAKIYVLQGCKDPHYTTASVDAFAAEMAQTQCDWQLHVFGKAGAEFSHPEAATYNKLADQRSDRLMRQFFEEIF